MPFVILLFGMSFRPNSQWDPPPPPSRLLAAHVADLAAAVHVLQEAGGKGAQQLVAEEAEVVGGPERAGWAQAGGGEVKTGGRRSRISTNAEHRRSKRGCNQCTDAGSLAVAHMAGPSRAAASSSTRRKEPTYSLWSPA